MAKAEYRSAVRSRRLICQALADLLHEKPLDKITVTDIVKRADINRGTFYAHYTDVSDAINHLTENTYRTVLETLEEYPAGKIPDPEVMLKKLQIVLQEDIEFYQKIMTSNIALFAIEKLRNLFLDYMMEHEKEFCHCGHEDYLFSIRFGAGAVSALYLDWFHGDLPLTLDELTEKSTLMIRMILKQSYRTF